MRLWRRSRSPSTCGGEAPAHSPGAAVSKTSPSVVLQRELCSWVHHLHPPKGHGKRCSTAMKRGSTCIRWSCAWKFLEERT